jgi:hypothetical protein
MYNPDKNEKLRGVKRKRDLLDKPDEAPPKKLIYSEDELLTKEQEFEHYCREYPTFREGMGIRIIGKKIEITDPVKLQNLEEWQVDILRRVCLELKRKRDKVEAFWEREV